MPLNTTTRSSPARHYVPSTISIGSLRSIRRACRRDSDSISFAVELEERPASRVALKIVSPDPSQLGCIFSTRLTGRLAGPALEGMRECADVLIAQQPCNLGNGQVPVGQMTIGEVRSKTVQEF